MIVEEEKHEKEEIIIVIVEVKARKKNMKKENVEYLKVYNNHISNSFFLCRVNHKWIMKNEERNGNFTWHAFQSS